jgi:hypothetical protein
MPVCAMTMDATVLSRPHHTACTFTPICCACHVKQHAALPGQTLNIQLVMAARVKFEHAACHGCPGLQPQHNRCLGCRPCAAHGTPQHMRAAVPPAGCNPPACRAKPHPPAGCNPPACRAKPQPPAGGNPTACRAKPHPPAGCNPTACRAEHTRLRIKTLQHACTAV